MPASVDVEIRGLREWIQAFRKFPAERARVLHDAATLIGDTVLDTEGLRKYPPSTEANQPPPPYYIRGRGMQVSGKRNLNNSERLGTKFYSRGQMQGLGSVIIRIGNPVSYAPPVIGEDQARAMARIGWRKLGATAKQKTGKIAAVFEALLAEAMKLAGLK